MTWLAGLSVLFLMTLCLSSAQEKGAHEKGAQEKGAHEKGAQETGAQEKELIEVRYQQRAITSFRGSSVKLSCNAFYDFKQCNVVHIVWCHLKDSHELELSDPSKYFTTVNETVSADNTRHRQVVTEILDLTPEDNGRYQCKASCDDRETAMGHFITITVKG